MSDELTCDKRGVVCPRYTACAYAGRCVGPGDLPVRQVITPFSSMTGTCPYHHENLPCSMCKSIANLHAACEAALVAAEKKVAALKAGLEQMSRIVCTCPSPDNRGIPTNTVPCPTHSSGRYARYLLKGDQP